MPFPKNRNFLDRLVASRFRSKNVRKLLDEESSSARQKRRRPQFLTGTHNGVFYRIKVPPQQRRLPTIPKLHTPTSAPMPLPPVRAGESVTAAAASKKEAQERRQEFWERLWLWLKDNKATLILNFGSICTLVGFTRTDVLELRGLAVTGSVCAVVYHFLLTPVRYPPILWSCTFAGVNSFKIFQIMVERQGAVNLSEEQEERYINFFMPHGVTPKQFELIDQKAKILHVKKGELLIKQHEELKHVDLVVSGSTRASILGRFLTAASTTPTSRAERVGGASGAWIGEMALLERVWLKEQGRSSSSSSSTSNNSSIKKAKSNGSNGEQQRKVTPSSGTPTTVKEKKDRPPETTPPPPIPPPTPAPASTRFKASHSMYTIVAQEDCTVLRWSHDDMQELMEKSTDMRAARKCQCQIHDDGTDFVCPCSE